MADGMAFDQLNPNKSITDPRGLGLLEYPKHLHKAGTAEDGGPLYVEVHDPAQEAQAIADGWRLSRAEALAERPGAEPPPPAPAARKR
jgi:hypothetical protein